MNPKIPKIANPRSPSPNRRSSVALPAPATVRAKAPLSASAHAAIAEVRSVLHDRIVHGCGPHFAIVGPCSIHCETAALEYAERLARVQERLGHRVQLIMRVYFEKPRTTLGWKGFIYDPDLNGTDDLARGIARARRLMVAIAELGVPMATEILDPLTAPFLEDCLSWVAIGARTSESQIHRQLASGLGCPVGFKNATDGSVDVAIDAIATAKASHSHLGVDETGQLARVSTQGNAACHVVLRGGKHGPNYSRQHVETIAQRLVSAGHAPRVLVDCSHQNSGKNHNNQPLVAREVCQQMLAPHADVMGIMLESHLHAGRQSLSDRMDYGVSVTDACIDFATTERVLEGLAELGPPSRMEPSLPILRSSSAVG